jgi:hypothetical protein
MDLLSSASLSELVTSIGAAFRRPKSALFGGAFLFPTKSRSPCCNTRSIPIGGDYEGKAAALSRPDGTLGWVKKPDESFAY